MATDAPTTIAMSATSGSITGRVPRRARSRFASTMVCAGLVAGLTVAGTTGTTAAAAATPAATSRITVFLKAPDAAALSRLASATGLTRAERLRALNGLVPSAAVHDRVEQSLRAAGFRVLSETSWSVTAAAAPERVAQEFGTRPSAGTHAPAARIAAATGALPRVPAGLAGLVSAAFPTSGGPAAFQHSTTSALNGADFRNAYAPATVTPSAGANDAGVTVATLQLADFYGPLDDPDRSSTASDLHSYASEHNLTLADGQYRAVTVDGGPSTDDDSRDGDIEVDLDQQSILSTAPTANQQAYFAPNTDAGFNDVFANVYDDVVGNSHATAPNPHIVALSTSWGACESINDPDSIAALEPILKSLLAAGVTIFASTGDHGIYDCGDPNGTGEEDHPKADVDYPASSPSVIAVGGSNLSATHSTPNTGTNWHEKAWSCADTVACESDQGSGGTGGGASGTAAVRGGFAGFAAPDYQRAGITAVPFANSAARLVPDITADGDPATGFTIYTSNPSYTFLSGTNDFTLGGTSLAAPISAAQFANALADAGHTTGVGDIHGPLYSAFHDTASLPNSSPTKVFRDITSGTNGKASQRGTDPSVKAAVGYDTVSGLGGVLWSALVPYLFETRHPTATVAISEPTLTKGSWRRVTAVWKINRGADTSLPGPTAVRITARGSSKPVFTGSVVPASNRFSFTGMPGTVYTVRVTGADLGGRTTKTVTATVNMPLDDSVLRRSSGWVRVAGAQDIGGSHLRTHTKGAALTFARTAHTYTAVFDTGPNSGKVGVYLGTKRIHTINLYSKGHGRLSVVIYRSATRAHRTFSFRALSTKTVNVDGVYLGY